MEEQSVELNENSSAHGDDSAVDRGSADGSVSMIVEVTEEKDAETVSCSISTNASAIEEKETSKSDRSDSTIVQIVEEKEAADFSCSLATNAPKFDEKETAEVSCLLAINAPKIDEKNAAVARCSYTTNAFENEEMGSSNSTSVSEVSGTDKSVVNNSSETLRVYEAVERQKKETGSAMKEITSETEEKETAKSECSDSTDLQTIGEKETAVVSSLLATSAQKVDGKESPVASCSFATKAFVSKATGSSNSASVSETPDSDNPSEVSDSGTESLSEELREQVNLAKTEAETGLKIISWVMDTCNSIILRSKDAKNSAQETLKRAERRIRDTNDDDLRFQCEHVAQIFRSARSSAESLFFKFTAEIPYVRGAYNLLDKAKKNLEAHVSIADIDQKINALKGAIGYKDYYIKHASNSIISAFEEMRNCYADLDDPEFLHARFVAEGRDPRTAYQPFCRRMRRFPDVCRFVIVTIFFIGGALSVLVAHLVNNYWFIATAVACFFFIVFIIVLYVAPKRRRERAMKKRRKAIQEIDKELDTVHTLMQNNDVGQ